MSAPMAAYYARRAAEYERIYDKPERQHDLAALQACVPRWLAGRSVLEVACGTGYWTEKVAPAARSILATDVNDEVLEIARRKSVPAGVVEYRRLDVYDVGTLERHFDAALAAFWWSHVPRAELPRFLGVLHGTLVPGARVVLLDNRYVEGSSTPLARTDENDDTWQVRSLDDGSTHEVLKNFPREGELERLLGPVSKGLEVTSLEYFWAAVYEVAT